MEGRTIDSQVVALQRLVMSIRQQLLGNDPSSQYRKILTAGGSVAGWFALTNNGVTININGATNPITGQSEGVLVTDNTTNEYSTLTPTDLIFVGPNSAAGACIDLGQTSGVGFLTLTHVIGTAGNGISLTANNGIALDSGAPGHSRTIVGFGDLKLIQGSNTLELTPNGVVGGLSATVSLAKITGGGSDGSITFAGGIATAYTPPT